MKPGKYAIMPNKGLKKALDLWKLDSPMIDYFRSFLDASPVLAPVISRELREKPEQDFRRPLEDLVILSRILS